MRTKKMNLIQELSSLAKIKISPTEAKKLNRQIEAIIQYIGEIASMNVGQKNTSETIISNVFREDTPNLWFKDQDRLIEMAPMKEKGLVKTRGVFETQNTKNNGKIRSTKFETNQKNQKSK
ncbi:MAG: hypothetical protein HYW78_04000 [Parcubacteria group bacterium]|nr:hypothetical protein [Parcubacteria group bacterium]